MNNHKNILAFVIFFTVPLWSMNRSHVGAALVRDTSPLLLLESTPTLMAQMDSYFKLSIERLLVPSFPLSYFFESMKCLENERRGFEKALTCTFKDTQLMNGPLDLEYADLFTSYILSTTGSFISLYKDFLQKYFNYLDQLLEDCSLLTVHDFFKRKKVEEELRFAFELYIQWRSLHIAYFSLIDYYTILSRLNKISSNLKNL